MRLQIILVSIASSPTGPRVQKWLDHSGNFLRFRDDWDNVYADGVKELNEQTRETTKREPTEREKKEAKCPVCQALWIKGSDTCTECGHVKKRMQFEAVAGEMLELTTHGRVEKDDKQSFYSELLYLAKEKNYNPHWADHKYKEKFGVWPRGLNYVTKMPTMNTMNWIKHKQIAYSKSMKKMDRRAA